MSLSHTDVWGNALFDYYRVDDPTGQDGNLSVDPELLDTSGTDPMTWDLHLATDSPLVDAGNGLDPDGSPADLGAFGGEGADLWDLDFDGYPGWWHPGPYNPAVDVPAGFDCDDEDPLIYPGSGC